MFRLIISHLQANSLQVKSQDALHTLGSQCVYIGEIIKPCRLPRRVKRAKGVTHWDTNVCTASCDLTCREWA